MKKIFINLTNGLEAIEKHNLEISDIAFIRIQSSHCEEHKFELILNELDSNFLMNLAIGNECIVYDYGSHTEIAKAVYIGLEWVKYVLYKRWYDREYTPVIKGKKVDEYFAAEYKKLSKRCKKRISYFKKFLLTEDLKLTGITEQTSHDNKYDYYSELVRRITAKQEKEN